MSKRKYNLLYLLCIAPSVICGFLFLSFHAYIFLVFVIGLFIPAGPAILAIHETAMSAALEQPKTLRIKFFHSYGCNLRKGLILGLILALLIVVVGLPVYFAFSINSPIFGLIVFGCCVSLLLCTELHVIQAAVWKTGSGRQKVLFDGLEYLELKLGEVRYSDEIRIDIAEGEYLSIAVAFQGEVTSGNCIAAHVQCSKNGNYAYAPQLDISRRSFMDSYFGNLPGIPAISAIEVLTEEKPEVIVCFGDSITQQSTWTVPLERLLNEHGHKAVVLNAGIGGNRLLLGPPEPALQVFGPSAMSRFERDVLNVEGITSVILALGTNDIGWIRKPEDIESAGADAVFAGLKALADMAHAEKLKVYVATLTPRVGSLDYSPEQERERLILNKLIQDAECFDKVLDFAAATADTIDSSILAPHCDSGDHLHPSLLGGLQMAECAYDMLSE